MLSLLILLLIPFSTASAQEIYSMDGVQDYANILEDASKLQNELDDFIHDTGIDTIIITENSIGSNTLEEYVDDIYHELYKNGDHMILFLSVEDRLFRVHTGSGIKDTMINTKTSDAMVEAALYDFKNGSYDNGFLKCMKEAAETIESSKKAEKSPIKINIGFGFFAVMLATAIFFIVTAELISNYRIKKIRNSMRGNNQKSKEYSNRSTKNNTSSTYSQDNLYHDQLIMNAVILNSMTADNNINGNDNFDNNNINNNSFDSSIIDSSSYDSGSFDSGCDCGGSSGDF
jgi:uncharacterized membrane protein YgcG